MKSKFVLFSIMLLCVSLFSQDEQAKVDNQDIAKVQEKGVDTQNNNESVTDSLQSIIDLQGYFIEHQGYGFDDALKKQAETIQQLDNDLHTLSIINRNQRLKIEILENNNKQTQKLLQQQVKKTKVRTFTGVAGAIAVALVFLL